MGKKANYKITKPKYLSFSSIIFVILIVGLFIILKKFICFHGDMLFWFFASTSQSMAALFAVGGLFAVFRFQAQEAKLRNLYDVFKEWCSIDKGTPFFGEDYRPDLWKDDQVVSIGRKAVEKRQKDIDDAKKEGKDMEKDLEKTVESMKNRINEIEDHEKIREVVLKGVKLPMLVILITFMISIGSLPFTSYISKNWLGLIILILTMALITYSIWCVFTYIRFSLLSREEPDKSNSPHESL